MRATSITASGKLTAAALVGLAVVVVISGIRATLQNYRKGNTAGSE